MNTGYAIVGLLNQRPAKAAVGGTQNAVAVEGIGGVVGIAGSGQHDAGLHADSAYAERWDDTASSIGAKDRQSIGERREGDTGWRTCRVDRLPDAAPGSAEINRVARKIRRIDCDGSDAARDIAIGNARDLCGTEGLPGCVQTGEARQESLLPEHGNLLLAGSVHRSRCG